jgi:hypothetical protein
MSSNIHTRIPYSSVIISLITGVAITILSGNIGLAVLYNNNVAIALTPPSSSTDLTIRNIEFSTSLDKAGDPLQVSTIASSGDRNCQVCSFIEYMPGPIGKAGAAYKSTQVLDLSGAQRVVFFARGEFGEENVAFVAIGKSSNTDSPPVLPDIFPNLTFAVISKNVTLTNNWARYELSLNGSGTTGVTDPFGFIVSKIKNQSYVSNLNDNPDLQFRGANPDHIAFFLKNVTLYSNPISSSYSNSSTTASPYSENTSAPYSENTITLHKTAPTTPDTLNTTAITLHKTAPTTPYDIRLGNTTNKAFTPTRENASYSIQKPWQPWNQSSKSPVNKSGFTAASNIIASPIAGGLTIPTKLSSSSPISGGSSASNGSSTATLSSANQNLISTDTDKLQPHALPQQLPQLNAAPSSTQSQSSYPYAYPYPHQTPSYPYQP